MHRIDPGYKIIINKEKIKENSDFKLKPFNLK